MTSPTTRAFDVRGRGAVPFRSSGRGCATDWLEAVAASGKCALVDDQRRTQEPPRISSETSTSMIFSVSSSGGGDVVRAMLAIVTGVYDRFERESSSFAPGTAWGRQPGTLPWRRSTLEGRPSAGECGQATAGKRAGLPGGRLRPGEGCAGRPAVGEWPGSPSAVANPTTTGSTREEPAAASPGRQLPRRDGERRAVGEGHGERLAGGVERHVGPPVSVAEYGVVGRVSGH